MALGEAIADGIGNLANSAFGYFGQKNLNRQAQANTQKNMKLQADLEYGFNRLSRQTSAVDEVAGLKMAGLNPAIASGQMQGVSVGGASAPSAGSMPSSRIDLVRDLLASAEMQQQEAVTANIKEETEALKIQNNRERGKDTAVNSLFGEELDFVMMSSHKDSVDYKWAKALKENPISQGTLDGLVNVLGTLDTRNQYKANMWQDKIREKVGQGQYYDESLTNAMQHLPKIEFERLQHENEKLIEEMILLQVESVKGTEETANIKKVRKQIEEQTKLIARQIQLINNTDLNGLLDSGEYWKALALEADRVAPSVVSGASTIAGAKMLKNGKPASGASGSEFFNESAPRKTRVVEPDEIYTPHKRRYFDDKKRQLNRLLR